MPFATSARRWPDAAARTPGVHAYQYTCNFHAETTTSAFKMPVSLNAFLDKDIRVAKCEIVDDGFHSRFDATGKTYCYTICTSQFGNPFYRNFSWHYYSGVDVDKMREAIPYILGEHDFKCFMATGSPIKNTVRTITGLEVRQEGELIKILVTANGFLYNMVRIIAGTLVYVGNGRMTPADVAEVVATGDRTMAGMTAPPQGLCLVRAYYD